MWNHMRHDEFLPDIPESESVSCCFSSLGIGVDGAGPMKKFKKIIIKNNWHYWQAEL